jgi:hypothetical protein
MVQALALAVLLYAGAASTLAGYGSPTRTSTPANFAKLEPAPPTLKTPSSLPETFAATVDE